MTTTGTTLLHAALTQPREEHFTPDLLRQLPLTAIRHGVRTVTTRYGDVRRVTPTSAANMYEIHAARGTYHAYAVVRDGALHHLRLPTTPPPRSLATLPFLALWAVTLLALAASPRVWTAPSTWAWVLIALPAGAFLTTLLLASPWAQSSLLLRPVAAAALAGVALSAARAAALPTGMAPSIASALLTAGSTALLLRLAYAAWQGRRIPANPVPLGPVLRGGRFVALQAGGTTQVNYHMAHAPMRYAVDFVGVNALGTRARGLYPIAPCAYAIFGAEVLAPVSGVVEVAVNDRADLDIPEADTVNPLGNHVVLRADTPDGRQVRVILAHLRQGSVPVEPGDRVRVGDMLGRVGNSGNTTEPHLHLGVTTGGTQGDPFTGEGMPFTVNGRWLTRNDVIEA